MIVSYHNNVYTHMICCVFFISQMQIGQGYSVAQWQTTPPAWMLAIT